MPDDSPDFRALFESAPGMYLVLSPALIIVAVSDAYLRATMTVRREILGRYLFDVFPDNPEDTGASGVGNLAASLDRALRQKRPDAMAVQKYDIPLRDSEGGGFEVRHWSPLNTPVLGEDGDVRYLIHRVEDVTEFVRMRERGTEQQSLTDALKSRSGQMEAEIYRRAQEVQDANRQLRQLHAELEQRVEQRSAELLRANEALRRSEEQLRQAQKLEALGRLAGGVAHDFNNLLSVVLSYSDFLLNDVGPSSPLRPDLEEIRNAGLRAADLTRQMLAFSRQQVLDPKILDLNEILGDVGKMLERLVGEDVTLKLAPGPGLSRVLADSGQIGQLLVNLAVNARDAMPNGGELTIETANVLLDDSYAGAHFDVLPGPHVMLAVRDTGVGMDKATQARIFEPFFTTKEKGKGTGLGLSTVFGIVKQSRGNIWLYSEPGRGTTFKIYLPVAVGELDERDEAPLAPPRGGDETILVVEDEQQVRKAVTEILRKSGYHVLVAGNPAEAIALCAGHRASIHALLTDVVMPGMNGRELSTLLCAQRPDMRVLFVSGYTNDVAIPNGGLGSGVAFLQKPLTPGSLSRKVRELLDAPRTS